jgi:calcineurin-like phosphoesterase family protein
MTEKDILPNLNQIVSYKNTLYKLTGVMIKKNDKGEIYYVAEIKDFNANSICWIRLEDVDIG